MSDADLTALQKPHRIQRRRTKGWRMPPNTVYVGRPTMWGNPFVPGKVAPAWSGLDRQVLELRDAFNLYNGYARANPKLMAAAREQLKGKSLACWCPLEAARSLGGDGCHADVLLEIAASGEVISPVKSVLMMCGHCKRWTGLLHGGAPSLCCECVQVHCRWLALGGNKYAVLDEEHPGGAWCPEALAPIVRFAEDYARRSGVTVAWLHEHGREIRSCDCGDETCEGLQMAHIKEPNPFDPYLPPYPVTTQ